MLTRRTVIWAATETTEGTDPAMTAANAILAWDVEVEPKGEMITRDILRDTLSPAPHVIGIREATLNFKTEVKGVGQGTVPEMHSVLVGCGFATGAHATTADIVYTLQSSESTLKSLSFYVFKDGNKHKVTGSRGSVKFTMEAGQYGVAEFEFMGKYNAVSAATVPDVSGLSGNKPPILTSAAYQIGGYSPICKTLELDLANTIVRRDDLNDATGVNSFRLSGRAPKMTFSADAVIEGTNPYWGDMFGEVVDTYSVQAGTVDGNTVQFSGFFQYDSITYADDDGVQTYEAVASMVSSDINSQNDEVQVTFT